MATEIALNLQPQDRIELNFEWWTIVNHHVSQESVDIDLVSEDRLRSLLVTVDPLLAFKYQQHDCPFCGR